MEKFQDPLALLRVQFGEVAVDLGGEFNLPGHAALLQPRAVPSFLPGYGCGPECVRRDTCPRDRRDARGWPRGHRRSWCVRCVWRAFRDVSRWIGEAEWLARWPRYTSIAQRCFARGEVRLSPFCGPVNHPERSKTRSFTLKAGHLPPKNSVRNAPGLLCQGCARSVPVLGVPSPPVVLHKCSF